MEWVRRETIGRGSFGKVDLAIVTKSGIGFPTMMAVKSAPVYDSESLKNEREILGLLGNDSDYIIRCFGDSCSTSSCSEENNGRRVYNVFLEYADGGSLFDRVRNCGGGGGGGVGLSVSDVRSYTTSLLRGLNDVHSNGFVHCDVKLQNILICSSHNSTQYDVVAKIADFGLAKRQSQSQNKAASEFRGTPLYMAPETAASGECESPADIWAVGCAVVEMLTGAPVWKNESNIATLLLKIAQQSPQLPANLSSEIRDFVEKCFIRDAAKRWTAEMLLNHPFIIEALNTKSSDTAATTISPRCPFDFPEFITPAPISQTGFDCWIEKDDNFSSLSESVSSSSARLRQLVSEEVPEWVYTDNWLMVR